MTNSDDLESRPNQRPELVRRNTGNRLKFKHTSSNLSSFAFAKDQTWINQSSQDEILFVDQMGPNQEEVRRRAQNRKRQRTSDDTQFAPAPLDDSNYVDELALQSNPDFVATDPSICPAAVDPKQAPSLSSHETTLRRSVSFQHDSPQIPDIQALVRPETQRAYSHSTVRSDIHPQTSPTASVGRVSTLSSPNYSAMSTHFAKKAAWIPVKLAPTSTSHHLVQGTSTTSSLYAWPPRFSALESACLLRLNMLVLARWADAGHPARHFSDTMSNLARTFPPLLNAILTCGATQLLSTPSHKSSRGIVRYQGILLPGVTREATIRCHDAAVADLLEYCNESGREYDDQVLAALTMLRYHEELLSITDQGEDRGQLLRIFNTFSTARNLYDPPPRADSQLSATDQYRTYFNSVRYSILRLAIRQELTSAYVSQVPIQMSLSPWLPLEQIPHSTPENDVFWSDKCLLHCVKVTNFCYSTTTSSPTTEWSTLKHTEHTLESTQPAFYNPLHYQHPTPTKPFPLIWYTSILPIMGVQFLGLAKLLLAVYNPHLPRIGAEVLAAQEHLADEVRAIIRTVCGIADSNPTVQPAYVHAQMAIMAGGVYFSDTAEQDAMLAILAHLEWEFGWPTKRDGERLREIWGRDK